MAYPDDIRPLGDALNTGASAQCRRGGPNAPSIGKANAGKVISPVVIHAPREPAERPFGARH